MTQHDDDLPGGLHFDGSTRDVQVGPMTGIVRYYPVPVDQRPVPRTRWWRPVLLFAAGLLLGVVLGAVLSTVVL
ncbi:hypothetical protein Lesp02_53260 [Lentzea sp. NBRC 105346]|uniref:hypothetical protein n=1 Tax=Lentzea sp. NBRC 105346 TaxID=3032205 RepID=UPI0024A0246F|nr:hypothetical protein [Lentzea sp. NBRC 105346]GLZ33138.1 hypothetical protein Lesp02_53260 [Lentzea sp. NBRC 105346]